MNEIDDLYTALRPQLRGISARSFRACLRGLEPTLAMKSQARTQLTIRRLRFDGEKYGDFPFAPGVNVLRAGNDKGKSSILKLIHLCLTGKNDLKKDVDSWIDRVYLDFSLDDTPHAIFVDKGKRPTGKLVRGDSERLDDGEVLISWRSGKEMQERLEQFFNTAFGLRPLMGTQKDSRKGSDLLLDSLTSYRAYFRGMYINQDMGYTSLMTDGHGYGNLFMKILGMLLGVRGIDAYFAVDARLAHLENELGKEERYHRRLEESLDLRDLAGLEEEISKLERYIDSLKVDRAGLLVRATSDDMDQRLVETTEHLMGLDSARQQTTRDLQEAELELADIERSVADFEAALAGQAALAAIHPEHCPVCETAIRERRRFTEVAEDECLLCHEPMPVRDDGEDLAVVLQKRLDEARSAHQEKRRRADALRIDLEELDVRFGQLSQQKRNLQTQLRSAHQGTAELDREIELESRYLGRLEAERENAAKMVSEDGAGSNIKSLLQRKKVLNTVLRHLRTLDADANERRKREFTERVQQYCTTIGFPGLEDITLDMQLRPKIYQNGKVYSFEELSPGEKVRFTLAFYLALAIATGEDLQHGAHPGLILLDSPGKEEMVMKDFEAVADLLAMVEEKHAASIQVIVATTIPAIRACTAASKQHFIENDEDPMFQDTASRNSAPRGSSI